MLNQTWVFGVYRINSLGASSKLKKIHFNLFFVVSVRVFGQLWFIFKHCWRVDVPIWCWLVFFAAEEVYFSETFIFKIENSYFSHIIYQTTIVIMFFFGQVDICYPWHISNADREILVIFKPDRLIEILLIRKSCLWR